MGLYRCFWLKKVLGHDIGTVRAPSTYSETSDKFLAELGWVGGAICDDRLYMVQKTTLEQINIIG